MKIVSVRIDDACPEMNQEKFYRMVREIEKIGIRGLVGIIPKCEDKKLNTDREDPMFWTKMRQLQDDGWTIALHGYRHVYDSWGGNLVARRKDSEFAGHTYEEQLDRIVRGREILESHNIHTDCFFAPAHTYDRNTLKALRDAGFRYLSDGCTKTCYKWYGLTMIPCRIRGIPKNRNKGVITIVTHPCAMSELKYDEYMGYLLRNREVLVDYRRLLEMPVQFSALKVIGERFYVFFIRYIKPWLAPAVIGVRDRIDAWRKGIVTVRKGKGKGK